MKNAMSKRGPVIEVSNFAVLHMNGRFSCDIAASFAQPMMADFMPTDAVNVAKRQQRPLVTKQRMSQKSAQRTSVQTAAKVRNPPLV